MLHETLFRGLLVTLTAVLLMVRVAHQKQFPKTEAVGGLGEVVLVVFPCIWALSLVLYLLDFSWFSFRVSLPEWLRWAGVMGMALCVPLSVWVYQTLGIHFSTKLQLREGHQLVHTGPYRFVRHPMYTTLFLCIVSAGLVSAHLVVMATGAAVVVAMALQIKKEETMLQEHFGSAYRDYREKTGAIVPKLCSRTWCS